MASLQSLLMPIHGVEYELSGIFQRGNRKHIQLPEDFDIKDPEVLLEECTYDFTVEKNVLSSIPNNDQKNKREAIAINDDLPKTTQQQRLRKQNKIEFPSHQSEPPTPADFSRNQTSRAKSNQHENYQDSKEESRHRSGGKKSKSEASSSSKSHRHQYGVEKYDRHDKDVGIPKDKSNLLDKFTDLLTDDVKFTEDT